MSSLTNYLVTLIVNKTRKTVSGFISVHNCQGDSEDMDSIISHGKAAIGEDRCGDPTDEYSLNVISNLDKGRQDPMIVGVEDPQTPSEKVIHITRLIRQKGNISDEQYYNATHNDEPGRKAVTITLSPLSLEG